MEQRVRMEQPVLEYDEFCRKTYDLGVGSVTVRYLFEKHSLVQPLWSPEMVQRVSHIVSDLIQKHGYGSQTFGTTVLAGAEMAGGCLVEFDIKGINIPKEFIRKFQDEVCHYLVNKRRSGNSG